MQVGSGRHYYEPCFSRPIFTASFNGRESRQGFHKILETGCRELWSGSRNRINPDETVACRRAAIRKEFAYDVLH